MSSDKPKRKTNPINKYIRNGVLILEVAMFGFCILTLFVLSRVDFGMMGGDCVGAGSYDELMLSGSVINLPDADINIRVKKAKGSCPQSVEVDRLITVGENVPFSSRIPSHIGDDRIEITVIVEGLPTCRFHVSVIGQVELSLEIAFQEMWTISGTRTEHNFNSSGDSLARQTRVNYECE